MRPDLTSGDVKMKLKRTSIYCFAVLLLMAPTLRAQDFSKYREFSLGTNLATVLTHTHQKSTDARTIHGRPALIQELNWWPPNLSGAPYRSDSVEQIRLSFYNDMLYKISVTYDLSATEGLTAEDMVKFISTKYGPATTVSLAKDATKNERQEPVASWDDSQYSFNLVRSSFTGGFQLAAYLKSMNAEAELALAEAVKLDKQEWPLREAERQKKEIDDREVARQKNQKSFRP